MKPEERAELKMRQMIEGFSDHQIEDERGRYHLESFIVKAMIEFAKEEARKAWEESNINMFRVDLRKPIATFEEYWNSKFE